MLNELRLTVLASLAFSLFACGAPKRAETAHHGHHPHGMVRDFNDAAGFAQAFDDPARDGWQKPTEVLTLLELKPGMVVADLGAGTGYFTAHLTTAVGPRGRVLSLDTAIGMVDYLRQRATRQGWKNVEARQVSADDPGLAPASVDRVLIVDTWHHVATRVPYARKLAVALRPGGRVLVVDFTKESEIGPGPEHRISAEQVISELTAAGLQAKALSESLPNQYVVEGRK